VEWEELATQPLLDLISRKVDVQKIIIDIDEFSELQSGIYLWNNS